MFETLFAQVQERARIRFRLNYGGCAVVLKSNHLLVVQRLLDYYDGFQDDETEGTPGRAIYAFHQQDGLERFREDLAGIPFETVSNGMRYHDHDGTRTIVSADGGLLLILRRDDAFVVGDVAGHLPELLELLAISLGLHWQRDGYLLVRAAGVERDGAVTLIAGEPGQGDDALLLHLLEHGYRFLGYVGVALRQREDGIDVVGSPLFPRVMLGNLLDHPRFRMLMSAEEQARIQTLPEEELYNPRYAREVFLDKFYAGGNASSRGRLAGIALTRFHWQGAPFEVRSLTVEALQQAKDLFAFRRDLRFFPDSICAVTDGILEAVHRQVPVAALQGDLDNRSIRRAAREIHLIED